MTRERTPVPAVGVVCFRGDDVLLIRRGTPPMENRWSLPGGRIEWGERARDAALRALREETGCEAELVGLVDVVDAILDRRTPESRSDAPWGHYVLVDYAARWVAGEPIAGKAKDPGHVPGPPAVVRTHRRRHRLRQTDTCGTDPGTRDSVIPAMVEDCFQGYVD